MHLGLLSQFQAATWDMAEEFQYHGSSTMMGHMMASPYSTRSDLMSYRHACHILRTIDVHFFVLKDN